MAWGVRCAVVEPIRPERDEFIDRTSEMPKVVQPGDRTVPKRDPFAAGVPVRTVAALIGTIAGVAGIGAGVALYDVRAGIIIISALVLVISVLIGIDFGDRK